MSVTRAMLILLLASRAGAAPDAWPPPELRSAATSFQDMKRTFVTLRPSVVDVPTTAVLICYTESTSHERAVEYTLSAHGRRLVEWTTARRYVAAPVDTFSVGDELTLRRQVDRQRTTLRQAFDGRFPIRFEALHVYVECRPLSRQETLRRVQPVLAEVDAALDRYQSYPPLELGTFDHLDEDPNRLLAQARSDERGLPVAAALLGWQDVEVHERVARMAALKTDRHASLVAVIAEAQASLPAPGQWVASREPGFELRAAGLDCSNRPMSGCVARLELRRSDGHAFACSKARILDLGVRAIDRDGSSLRVKSVDNRTTDGEDCTWRAVETSLLRLVVVTYSFAANPHLLQINRLGKADVLRLDDR